MQDYHAPETTSKLEPSFEAHLIFEGARTFLRNLSRENPLNPTERMALLNIFLRMGRNEASWPSVATLSRDLGVSETVARAALHRLARDGYLLVERRQEEGRGNIANRYRLGPSTHQMFAPLPQNPRHPTSESEVGLPQNPRHPTSESEAEGRSREEDQEKEILPPHARARASDENDLVTTLLMRVRREGDPLTEDAYRLLIREKGLDAVREAASTIQMRYPPGRRTPWPSVIGDLLGVEMVAPAQRVGATNGLSSSGHKLGVHNGLIYDGEGTMETGKRAEKAQALEKVRRMQAMTPAERVADRILWREKAGLPQWWSVERAERWIAELDEATSSTQESDLELIAKEEAS